jgi:uncharacterized protein YidB (DUF937 family)
VVLIGEEAKMGLLDVLEGMQNGPGGDRQPGGASGGVSPMTVALVGVLAYKAFKSFAGSSPVAAQAGEPAAAGIGGGLGQMVSRMFGGAAGGGAGGAPVGPAAIMGGGVASLLASDQAGAVVSGGLQNLVKELHDNGHAQAAQSWVGQGRNEEIAPQDLAHVLGADTVDALVQQTGIDRGSLLAGLSQHLPEFVNQLTPKGRLPTEAEASRMM